MSEQTDAEDTRAALDMMRGKSLRIKNGQWVVDNLDGTYSIHDTKQDEPAALATDADGGL